MGGLNKRSGAGAKYVKIKNGNFYLTTDKEESDPYQELTGQIIDFAFKDDEWEGQTIRKLQITLTDGEDNYILSFPVDSSYTSSFVGFAKNADLTQEITLHPVVKEAKDSQGKEVQRRSLLVSQNGKFMKAYYTKDDPKGLPKFKKLKVSGKDVWDKTDFLEFLENVINTDFRKQLPEEGVERKTSLVNTSVSDPDTDTVDDLPF